MIWFKRKPSLATLQPLFHWARHNSGLSLAWRIALINMGGMILAIVGLLYLNQSASWFIEGEFVQMRQQAQFVGDALSETVLSVDPEASSVQVDQARVQHILSRLTEGKAVSAQFFSETGTPLGENKPMGGDPRFVFLAPLPSPVWQASSWVDRLGNVFTLLAERIPYAHGLPLYSRAQDLPLLKRPEIVRALSGDMGWALWQGPDQRPILTLASPVRFNGQVIGALLLTRTSDEVARVITQMRSELLTSFSLFLLMSVLVSLYMAQKVVRPLQKLSAAAAQAQQVANGMPHIPDYTARGDEVGELSGALKGMTDALWERLGTIERFAADVSHELKNPITSMKSALETMARLQDPERRERLMGILREDVTRLEKLITEIASTTRLEGELSRQTPEVFNLVGLVSSYVTSKSQAGLPLDLHVNTSRLFVNGLPSGILQVIDNLVGNALSFSPEGHKVRLRLTDLKQNVALSVEDDGPGLPLGTEQKIFERFYSLRRGAAETGTHSGLGLSISRQIAQSHGGSLVGDNRLDPATGQILGAIFTLTLPQVPPRKAKKAR